MNLSRLRANAPNHDETEDINALNRMEDIIIVADNIGDHDILAIALIRNLKSLFQHGQTVETSQASTK